MNCHTRAATITTTSGIPIPSPIAKVVPLSHCGSIAFLVSSKELDEGVTCVKVVGLLCVVVASLHDSVTMGSDVEARELGSVLLVMMVAVDDAGV